MSQHLSPDLLPCPDALVAGQDRKSLIIGIPIADVTEETRMPITPQGVAVLVAQGHQVRMQRGAGRAARFADEQYSEAGARLVDNPAAVFDADIVVMVAPPTEDQLSLIRDGQSLAFMVGRHLRPVSIFHALSAKRCTLLAIDEMASPHSAHFPCCEPIVSRCLGEVDGMLAVGVASQLLMVSPDGAGKGVVVGGVTGVPPTEVVILGSDMSAMRAARAAQALGSCVKVFDEDLAGLQRLMDHIGPSVFTSVLHPQALDKALRSADVVIASRSHSLRRSFVVPESYVSILKRGAVFVDLDSSRGGRAETTHPTTLAEPTFVSHGVVHHALPDMSVLAPHTASIVISDVLTPVLDRVAQAGGLEDAARHLRFVQEGIALYQGATTSRLLASRTGAEHYDLRLLII